MLNLLDEDLYIDKDSSVNKSDFVPNFVKYPDFHYGNKDLFDIKPVEVLKTNLTTREIFKKEQAIQNEPKTSEIITIRVKSSTDEDFIELDIDKLNIDFEAFKDLCRKELDHIDVRRTIFKVRKLPNILMRNSSDVRRLKNEQEIEIIFV
jgi:hypothetical protein